MKKTRTTRALTAILLGATLAGSLTACASDESTVKEVVIDKTKYESKLMDKSKKTQEKDGSVAAFDELISGMTSGKSKKLYCEDTLDELEKVSTVFEGLSVTEKEQFAIQSLPTLYNQDDYYSGDDLKERITNIKEAEPYISDDGESASVLDVDLVKEGGKWTVCDY